MGLVHHFTGYRLAVNDVAAVSCYDVCGGGHGDDTPTVAFAIALERHQWSYVPLPIGELPR